MTVEIDQTAGTVNAAFELGDSVRFSLSFTTPGPTGADIPLNLIGYTFAVTLYLRTGAVDGSVTVSSAIDGVILISFADTDIAKIDAGSSVAYRLKWTTPANVRQTPVIGEIAINNSKGGSCAC